MPKLITPNVVNEKDALKKSIWWYRDIIKSFTMNKAALRKAEIGYIVKRPQVGNMYCYYYDAKTKEQLPHWDVFPIMIPIDYYNDGWLGINLHYLPPPTRKIFFAELLKLRNEKTITQNTELLVTYQLLQNVSGLESFKQCIKRYLYSFVRSPFLEIDPRQWTMVANLPLQAFKKGGKEGAARPWYQKGQFGHPGRKKK